MAEAPADKAPKPPKFYKVMPYQMSRDDGTGSWFHGQWVLTSEFNADELERLVSIGALEPVKE